MDKIKLPPIEHFYGQTPMSVWISNCKPFVPHLDFRHPPLYGLIDSRWFTILEELPKFKRDLFRNQFQLKYELDRTEYKMSDEIKAQKEEDWKILYLNHPVKFNEDSMSRSLLSGRFTGKTLEAIKFNKETVKSISALLKLKR